MHSNVETEKVLNILDCRIKKLEKDKKKIAFSKKVNFIKNS
jgi:hypothetical protein